MIENPRIVAVRGAILKPRMCSVKKKSNNANVASMLTCDRPAFLEAHWWQRRKGTLIHRFELMCPDHGFLWARKHGLNPKCIPTDRTVGQLSQEFEAAGGNPETLEKFREFFHATGFIDITDPWWDDRWSQEPHPPHDEYVQYVRTTFPACMNLW